MTAAISSPETTGLSGASVDETKSREWALHSLGQVGGSVTWSAGVSAGVVVFEIAPTSGYSGTWHAIFTSTNPPVASTTESFTYPGPFSGFGRWRVDTAVSGGTVSTDTVGLY